MRFQKWHRRRLKVKVKLATLVEGDPKAPFSIATTPSYRGGRYSIPRIAPLNLWSSSYCDECLARRHQVPIFESFVSLDLGLNLRLPNHWRTLYSLANTTVREYFKGKKAWKRRLRKKTQLSRFSLSSPNKEYQMIFSALHKVGRNSVIVMVFKIARCFFHLPLYKTKKLSSK